MTNIGTISYAIGGIAFLVLSTLLVTSWRGRLQGGLIVAAASVSTLWCFFCRDYFRTAEDSANRKSPSIVT